MEKNVNVKEALEDYFGEEFPECKNLNEDDYLLNLYTLPSTLVRHIDLTTTYGIARYFNEEHINVVEAFSLSAGLNKQ